MSNNWHISSSEMPPSNRGEIISPCMFLITSSVQLSSSNEVMSVLSESGFTNSNSYLPIELDWEVSAITYKGADTSLSVFL